MEAISTKLPTIMKALGDENRLKILSMLESGSLCACNMLSNLHISQSTLSHHMAILSEAGLVSAWSVGKWTHYRLCPQGLDLAESFLSKLQASTASLALENKTQANATLACTCANETSTETEMSIA